MRVEVSEFDFGLNSNVLVEERSRNQLKLYRRQVALTLIN